MEPKEKPTKDELDSANRHSMTPDESPKPPPELDAAVDAVFAYGRHKARQQALDSGKPKTKRRVRKAAR